MGIGTAIGVGGAAIGAGIVGSHGASSAANAQAAAADQAAQLQFQEAQQALDFEKQVFSQQQVNQAPWLQGGSSAMVNLANLMGILPSTYNSTAVPTPQVQNTTVPNPFATPEAQLTTPSAGSGNETSAQGPQSSIPMSALLASTNTADFSGKLLPGFEIGGIPSVGGPGGPPVTSMNPVSPQAGQGTPPQPAANPTIPLSALMNPSLGATGSLMNPWAFEFQAPTEVTEQNDPGFQFRLQQGQQALENSAAARGGLLSGATGKALERYGQDYSSNEYQNVFNRSLTDYQQAYNQFQQAQANQFNRLAAMAGIGQTSAGQLNSAGASAAQNTGNILLGSGQQIGNNLLAAGNARASGYLNQANALNGTLGNLVSLFGLGG